MAWDEGKCPFCDADLSYQVEGRDRVFSRLIGVEVRGVYDGVAFWMCPDCQVRWHRFPPGHYVRRRIDAWADKHGHTFEEVN